MVRRFLVALLLFVMCAVGPTAQAPVCEPAPIEFLLWGEAGQGIVAGQTVPEGEVWKIRAAGIATDDGQQREWMLQIDHPVATQGGVCCWLIPLMRLNGTAAGTPTLALNREVVLIAGERLSARVNGLASTKKMVLLYVGWTFPASCTRQLVAPGG